MHRFTRMVCRPRNSHFAQMAMKIAAGY